MLPLSTWRKTLVKLGISNVSKSAEVATDADFAAHTTSFRGRKGRNAVNALRFIRLVVEGSRSYGQCRRADTDSWKVHA